MAEEKIEEKPELPPETESPIDESPVEDSIEMPGGSVLGVEGLVMLFLAALIDLVGMIITFCALDDFWILDIIGFIFIGSWFFLRFGNTNAVPGKIGKKVFKRLGLASLIEVIPLVGGISPSWTIAVYYELKNN